MTAGHMTAGQDRIGRWGCDCWHQVCAPTNRNETRGPAERLLPLQDRQQGVMGNTLWSLALVSSARVFLIKHTCSKQQKFYECVINTTTTSAPTEGSEEELAFVLVSARSVLFWKLTVVLVTSCLLWAGCSWCDAPTSGWNRSLVYLLRKSPDRRSCTGAETEHSRASGASHWDQTETDQLRCRGRSDTDPTWIWWNLGVNSYHVRWLAGVFCSWLVCYTKADSGAHTALPIQQHSDLFSRQLKHLWAY